MKDSVIDDNILTHISNQIDYGEIIDLSTLHGYFEYIAHRKDKVFLNRIHIIVNHYINKNKKNKKYYIHSIEDFINIYTKKYKISRYSFSMAIALSAYEKKMNIRVTKNNIIFIFNPKITDKKILELEKGLKYEY